MIKLTTNQKEQSKIESCIKKCQNRTTRSLNGDFEYHHLAISRSTKFLRMHDSEKIKMFILFVDLGGSTKMSSELSPDALAKIIRLFSQEMAYIVESYDGFVLKYVGDAVIGYFPERKALATAKNAVFCAKAMVSVIENAINPAIKNEKMTEGQLTLQQLHLLQKFQHQLCLLFQVMLRLVALDPF